jgi:hypothetical protein
MVEVQCKYNGNTIVFFVLVFGFCIWVLDFLTRVVFIFLIFNHKLHSFNNIKY